MANSIVFIEIALLWLGGQSQPTVRVSESPPAFVRIAPVLYVRDIRKSVAFYRDVLGFAVDGFTVAREKSLVKELESTDDPYGAALHVGSDVLSLQRLGKFTVGGSQLNVVMRNLTGFHKRLAETGIQMHKVTPIIGGGMLCFSVNDPDGHEIFFLEPPEPGR
jgi:catechol 2,3-dioxygenase-like lactoylglutathione lyase family enzyme